MADVVHLTDEPLPFVHPDDLELFNAWDSKSFDLQVANHELLGHGSGKLFQEDADGKKNFDPEKVITSPYQLVVVLSDTIHKRSSIRLLGNICNCSSFPP